MSKDAAESVNNTSMIDDRCDGVDDPRRESNGEISKRVSINSIGSRKSMLLYLSRRVEGTGR
jgi:hypothetical protein